MGNSSLANSNHYTVSIVFFSDFKLAAYGLIVRQELGGAVLEKSYSFFFGKEEDLIVRNDEVSFWNVWSCHIEFTFYEFIDFSDAILVFDFEIGKLSILEKNDKEIFIIDYVQSSFIIFNVWEFIDRVEVLFPVSLDSRVIAICGISHDALGKDLDLAEWLVGCTFLVLQGVNRDELGSRKIEVG